MSKKFKSFLKGLATVTVLTLMLTAVFALSAIRYL